MREFSLWIQRLLIWLFPLVLLAIGWSFFQSDLEIREQGSILLTGLWEVVSWIMMAWFLLLFVFLLLLVLRVETQENVIKNLVGLKERDEREEIISGLASRRAFIATTALLIVLLVMSCFTLSVARLPDNSVDGKKGMLTIGFNLSGADRKSTVSSEGSILYEHHDIPLSKSALILVVLVCQISVFRWKARKELLALGS